LCDKYINELLESEDQLPRDCASSWKSTLVVRPQATGASRLVLRLCYSETITELYSADLLVEIKYENSTEKIKLEFGMISNKVPKIRAIIISKMMIGTGRAYDYGGVFYKKNTFQNIDYPCRILNYLIKRYVRLFHKSYDIPEMHNQEQDTYPLMCISEYTIEDGKYSRNMLLKKISFFYKALLREPENQIRDNESHIPSKIILYATVDKKSEKLVDVFLRVMIYLDFIPKVCDVPLFELSDSDPENKLVKLSKAMLKTNMAQDVNGGCFDEDEFDNIDNPNTVYQFLKNRLNEAELFCRNSYICMVMYERNIPELANSENKILRYIAQYWQIMLRCPGNQNCAIPSQLFFLIDLNKKFQKLKMPDFLDYKLVIVIYPRDSRVDVTPIPFQSMEKRNLAGELFDSKEKLTIEEIERRLFKLATVIIKSGLGYAKNHLPITPDCISEIKTPHEMIDYLLNLNYSY